MKKILYSIIALGTLLACTSPSKKVPTEASGEDLSKMSTAQSGTEQPTSKVITDYIALKDALVKSDPQKARDAAGQLMVSLGKERMAPEIAEAANSIAETQDIEVQRENFKTVTDKLIAAYQAQEEKAGLFVQYCPMAFDNTGASWLSTTSEIRNPYFGDKMLKCGKVTEEI